MSITSTHAQVILKQDLLQLKGKIAEYPITMMLTSDNGPAEANFNAMALPYRGVYYYDKVQQPIFIMGKISSNHQKISLEVPSGPSVDDQTEYFELTANSIQYNGYWIGGKKNTKLPVVLWLDSASTDFDLYTIIDSFKLMPTLKNSPEADFNASILWPVKKNSFTDYLKKEIVHYIRKGYNGTDINYLLRESRNEFLKEYKNDMKDVSASDVKESNFGYNYESSQQWSVQYESDNILSLAVLNYFYSGGAHGYGAHDYLNIDKKRKKVIHISEVLINPQSKQLLKILEKRYRMQLHVPMNTSLTEAGLFDNEIKELAGVFYLTEKGIGFLYNQYEIAPYGAGPIEIFVPFSDLSGMLSPTFQRILH